MACCQRRSPSSADWVRAGQWTQSVGPDQYGVDVQGKTLGIVGLGRIGGAVARRAARGFKRKVLFTKRAANCQAQRQ